MFTGIYFHPLFYRPFPQGVQILLQLFYVVFICDFPINYAVISEESNTRVDLRNKDQQEALFSFQ